MMKQRLFTPLEAKDKLELFKLFYKKQIVSNKVMRARLLTGFILILLILQTLSVSAGPVQIDSGYGEVVKRYTAGSDNKFIIHIQDAHGNYSAQKTIANILEQLIKEEDIKLVLVEGGSGNDSLSYLREQAPKERRAVVAERYLKNGQISGEEYLDLVSDYNFKVYGIEDKYLYNQNMCVFTEVEPIQKSILEEIDKLETAINYAKKKYYPKEILDLEVKEKDYEARIINLPEYVTYLEKLNSGVDLPNLTRYREAIRLEEKIDFPQVDKERAKIIEVLVQLVSKETLETILLKSAKFRMGQIDEKDFYSFLIRIGDSLKIDWLQYPMFYKYWEYVNKINTIDNLALINEIEAWEGKIKEVFLKEQVQKELANIDNKLRTVVKLISLELSPDEAKEDKFNIDDWVAFLEKNTDLPIYINTAIINDNIPKFQRFYQLAYQRDNAFIENAIKRMRIEGEDVAVLIAGGFHTENLMRQLEEQGISYVIVKPRFKAGEGGDRSLYFQTLKKKWR